MNAIDIAIREKIATKICDTVYICGNSDFIVRFDFDEEWNDYEAKTVRFVTQNNEHVDVPFVGNECAVPVFSDVHNFRVGVFAGNLHTTTSAYVPCKKSILCGTGDKPIVPKEDAYDKMMEDINADAVRAEKAANKAEEHAEAATEAMEQAVGSGFLVVHFSFVDGTWQADHTYQEINAAKQEGKTLLAVGGGRVYGYSGEFADTGHLFTNHHYESGVGIVENLAKVASDNTAKLGTYKPATTPNPRKLTIVKGDEEIGYDGSEAVTVEIPSNDLFVVRELAGTVADKTIEEIRKAVLDGKTCVLLSIEGAVYTYRGEEEPVFLGSEDETVPTFYLGVSFTSTGIDLARAQFSSTNNRIYYTRSLNVRTPNPYRLTFSGAISAEYDGSNAVRVVIPQAEDGKPGEDGFSPTVEVDSITGGHRVTITDKDGEKSFDVMDGEDGEGGGNTKQITGQISGSNVTFDMPVADMIALGEGLKDYRIVMYSSETWEQNSYLVSRVKIVLSSSRTMVYLYATGDDDYVCVTLSSVNNMAMFSSYDRQYYKLPNPLGNGNMYLGTDDSGNYVLKEAPTGSASAPMLQMFDTDGVLTFLAMDSGEPTIITLEMLMMAFGDNMVNLKVMVIVNNAEVHVYSFSYMSNFEDTENPPYILFGSFTGKTIRMEVDGTLSYVQ